MRAQSGARGADFRLEISYLERSQSAMAQRQRDIRFVSEARRKAPYHMLARGFKLALLSSETVNVPGWEWKHNGGISLRSFGVRPFPRSFAVVTKAQRVWVASFSETLPSSELTFLTRRKM